MPVSSKKEKILIIEGNGQLGDQIAQAVRADGYTVTVVKEAGDAITTILSVQPSLIILDLILPGGDAYTILTQKQADPTIAPIKVFLLSTQGEPITMSRVTENSVSEYIVSLELDPSDIVRRINKNLGYAETSATPSQKGPMRRVVWVEDDKLIGSILEKKFTSSGLELFHAKDGAEMLAYLATHIPDVIVLDLLLPGMNGFDILQKIRMDERLKSVPAMILSNLSKPSDIEKAKVLGASKFVIKAATSLDHIIEDVKGLAR